MTDETKIAAAADPAVSAAGPDETPQPDAPCVALVHRQDDGEGMDTLFVKVTDGKTEKYCAVRQEALPSDAQALAALRAGEAALVKELPGDLCRKLGVLDRMNALSLESIGDPTVRAAVRVLLDGYKELLGIG